MIQVLVATGGDAVAGHRLARWAPFTAVIAADSGAAQAVAAGYSPDVIVGDFDSVSDHVLQSLSDADLAPAPRDKDQTDLELALDLAVERWNADSIVVAGGGGGRVDHLFGNAAAIAGARDAAVTWVMRHETAYPVRGSRTIVAGAGSTVSILPWGPAVVSTDGLRWRLSEEQLDHMATRGVSNVAESDEITVTAHEGVVFVVVNG